MMMSIDGNHILLAGASYFMAIARNTSLNVVANGQAVSASGDREPFENPICMATEDTNVRRH
jgi:hypothetical protein